MQVRDMTSGSHHHKLGSLLSAQHHGAELHPFIELKPVTNTVYMPSSMLW